MLTVPIDMTVKEPRASVVGEKSDSHVILVFITQADDIPPESDGPSAK